MIKKLKESLDISLKEIYDYQNGNIKQIKTNRPWLDDQGGILLQSIILICGASFGGKSTELENLKADIMNQEINPDADEYVWLSNNFEMTMLATTLRDIRKKIGKNFKEILNNCFNDREKEILKNYYKNKTDGRFYINQEPLPSDELLKVIEQFIIDNNDKKAIFIDIDHAALIRASNDGKKGAIDDFVEGINSLKKKYRNVIFIILTQLNRTILNRIAPKSNDMAIQRGDIYQSDTMFHIADYIYGLQNPFYFKIDEYRKINPDKYPHLEHRFCAMDAKGKVSLITEGCIFVEILKDRTADFDFVDLYTIEILPITNKPKEIQSNSFLSNDLNFDDIDDCPF